MEWTTEISSRIVDESKTHCLKHPVALDEIHEKLEDIDDDTDRFWSADEDTTSKMSVPSSKDTRPPEATDRM